MTSRRARHRGRKTKKNDVAEKEEATTAPTATTTASILQHLWVQEGLCASREEAQAVYSDFVMETDGDIEQATTFQEAMVDYFNVTTETAQTMWQKLIKSSGGGDGDDDDVDSSHSDDSYQSDGDPAQILPLDDMEDDSDDDDEFVGEGECALCERFILLSRHHLIPRSTWPRFEARLLTVAQALQDGDEARAQTVAGVELEHLIPDLKQQPLSSESAKKKSQQQQRHQVAQSHRARVKHALQRTTDVCRPCHSAIHKTYDNLTLAWNYNTLEKLWDDEALRRYAKWASQQKAGRFARHGSGGGGNGGVPKYRSKHKSKQLY
mmetsp:Transcript_9209/g.19852  ORF Transcript_9209/g.19852 Transcript_9209/m.19852 type:complete len:322 (+) Transcript_9209:111-1076(+)|eukprot:CAMPEP_0168782990 /NCGR_PEP_ID=MMETSP0725-20121227/9450_1 /TAXON_ID=265536 /ORGANISM="Amphiprora sp., Strain CCMP467" /LENGTH=321 /DNA_ID=CAMNT_0008832943 /DNA_START=77 /DNA_END=1042 /DNA_ORIENTATION=+